AFRIARMKSRQEIERDRPRKFRRCAEPTFARIKTAVQLFECFLKNAVVDLAGRFRLRVLRFTKRLHNFRSTLRTFLVVLFPGGRNSFQDFSESRLTKA